MSVLIFNAGRFTNVDLTALVGNVPAEVGRCRVLAQCRTPLCPQGALRQHLSIHSSVYAWPHGRVSCLSVSEVLRFELHSRELHEPGQNPTCG